jgi:hypothetical protein
MKGFWSSEVAPAWVQAAVSAMALVLAIFAYNSWKEQEVAKRRADLAIQILRDAYSASECLNEARSGFLMSEKEVMPSIRLYREIAVEVGPKKLEKCAGNEASLRVYGVTAHRALDDDVASNLVELARQFLDLKMAHLRIEYMARLQGIDLNTKDDRKPIDLGIDNEPISFFLAQAGLQKVPEYALGKMEDANPPDKFKSRVTFIQNELDKALEGYINFRR